MKQRWVIGFGIAAISAAVWACSEVYATSVHFNDVADFGSPPPPLAIGSWEEFVSRPIPGNVTDFESDFKASQDRDARIAANRTAALDLEAKGLPAEITEAWLRYADDRPDDAEFARDRAEVWRQTVAAPSDLTKSYLAARLTLVEKPDDRNARTTIEQIAANVDAGFIRAHASYALGALDFDAGKFDTAARNYFATASLGGPRREPALVMAIRSTLAVRPSDGTSTPILPEQIRLAQEELASFEKEFPKSRFLPNLEGWRARIAFLKGDKTGALATYLRQLSATKNRDDQVALLSSIRTVIDSLTAPQAKEVRKLIVDRPELLGPYLDYRLYHTGVTAGTLSSLASFANEVLAAHPKTEVRSDIAARLAELNYLRGDLKSAKVQAERSLADEKGSRLDLATFVRSSVLAKEGKLVVARNELVGFENRFATSYLAKSAVEQRALLRERTGDWYAALDDYLWLGYGVDAAYLVDVRFTPAMVEQYARMHASHADANRWRLAAGFRRLRSGAYDDAARWFKSIPTAERRKLASTGSSDYSWLFSDQDKGTLDRIPDPLTTVQEMRKLASDPSIKGKYAFASYLYSHRNLLLYNADLWHGGRGRLGWGWNDKVASKADDQARTAHHFEHECLWRARQLCLDIVKKAPKDPIAPKALYRAATATRRLANFNPWWRTQNQEVDRYAEAADLLHRLSKDYPRHALAKNARKYEKVFRAEGKSAETQTLFQ